MATIDKYVAAGTDDTFQSGSSSYYTSYYGVLDSASHNAWRFTGISGLAGATINSATLTINRYINTTGTSLIIDAEKAAAPAAFNGTSNEVSSRTFTTATKTPAAGDSSGFLAYDVASLIQEIVDAGHDPSAIMLRVRGNPGSSSNYCYFYEQGPTYPRLQIDYTPAPAGSKPRSVTVQLQF